MRTKLLTIAATGVAGLVLGAGVGIAAAQSDGRDTARPPVAALTSEFDSMDEMHSSMPAEMRSMEPGAMGSMAARHAQHHG